MLYLYTKWALNRGIVQTNNEAIKSSYISYIHNSSGWSDNYWDIIEFSKYSGGTWDNLSSLIYRMINIIWTKKHAYIAKTAKKT